MSVNIPGLPNGGNVNFPRVSIPSVPTTFSFNTVLNAGAMSNIIPPVPTIPTFAGVPNMPAIPNITSGMNIVTNGVNTMLVNPVNVHVAEINNMVANMPSLGKLGEMSGMSAAISSIQQMASSTQTLIDSEIESLKTKLPIMSAVAGIEKLPGALAGNLPSIDPPALLAQSTTLISSAGLMMERMKTTLQGHIDNMLSAIPSNIAGNSPAEKLTTFASTFESSLPPAKILDPVTGLEIDNPNYQAQLDALKASTPNASGTGSLFDSLGGAATNVASSLGDANELLNKAQAAGAVALEMGKSVLKDVAFAKFVTSNQPKAVQDILSKFVSPPSARSAVERQVMSTAGAAQATVNNTITTKSSPVRFSPANDAANAANIKDTVPPKVSSTTDQQSRTNWHIAFDSNVKSKVAIDHFVADFVAPRRKVLEQWKEDNNYAAVKAASIEDPNDRAKASAYKQLRQQLEQTNGPDPAPNYVEFERCRKILVDALNADEESFAALKTMHRTGIPAGKALIIVTKNFGANNELTVDVATFTDVT